MYPGIKPTQIPVMVPIVVITLMLSACAPSRQMAPANIAVEAPMEKAVGAVEQPVADFESAQEYNSSNPSGYSPERIVIKNGNMTIVVVNPQKSIDEISKMADEMGGFVVSSNLYKDQIDSGAEVPRGSITIRIPAERMSEGMQRIRKQSTQEPINESTTSQDVTSEYVDLQSRLKNLEAAETELNKIMQTAKKTEDVLAVYNELVSIREQIEVVKGQIKYYEESAALSAISIELIADKAVQPFEIGGWQPAGIVKDALEALLKTFQFLVNALIWIILYLLPVLLVLGIIFILPPVLIIRAIRRRKSKKEHSNSQAKE